MANKYYWLKLKEDFFDDETIRYIEEQENGYKYSNFYLKLCLKSVRYNGRLIRLVGETLIPYDVKSLARLTGVDVDTVRCAMALLEKVGCVKILESGEIYLSQVEEMIGKETDKAAMMRRLRAEKKKLVTMLPERYPEIDIDIEKDKEKEPPIPPEAGEAEALGKCADFYQQNIGTLAPSTYQQIQEWLKVLPAEVIVLAMKAAVDNGKRNWAYIKAILKRCEDTGIKSRIDWEAAENARNRPANASEDKRSSMAEARAKLRQIAGGAVDEN